jgi:hypothetical protein
MLKTGGLRGRASVPRAAPPSVGYGITRSVRRRAGYVHRTAEGGGGGATAPGAGPRDDPSRVTVRSRARGLRIPLRCQNDKKLDISAKLASIELSRDVFEQPVAERYYVSSIESVVSSAYPPPTAVRPSACLAVALAWWGVLPR